MSRIHAVAAAGAGALAVVLASAATAVAAPAPQWDVYVGEVSRDQLAKIVELGVDRHEMEISKAAGGKDLVRVETVISGAQAQELASDGVELEPKEIDGQTVAERATLMAAQGFEVWKHYSGPGGLKEECPAHRGPQLAHREARLGRQDGQGRGHRRHQAEQGRAVDARRLQAVDALHRRPARARVDHAGDEPPAHALPDRRLRARRQAHPPAARRERAVDRPGRQPGRLRLLVHRGPAAVAQEPARQRQQRHGDPGRRRRPQPQLGLSLGLRQRGLLARPERPHVARARRELRARDAGARQARQARRLRVLHQLPLRGRAAALRHRLAGRHADAGRHHRRGDDRRRRESRGPRL